MKITLNHLVATNDVFTKLNNLMRWTDMISQPKYNELNKQGLNCIIALFLAKRSEQEGKPVNYNRFPHIAIGRAFAKAYVYFDTPEHKIEEICNHSGISKKEFDGIATEIITEKTDKDFAKFLSEDINEYEVQIYKAATKIATYIELLELKQCSEYDVKLQEISKDLKKYISLPGVEEFSNIDSPIFKLFQKISTLRNQARWATHSCNLECSVLGHSFDTAVWAYLFALDESNFDEDYATKMFFMGIFHDLAEVWTKDIPSPIKDRIRGFRKATEAYELKMLEENMYSIVPEYMKNALREVMMEDEINSNLKVKMKAADYMSAYSECYRFMLSGSKEEYFCNVIIGSKILGTSKLYIKMHKYFVVYAKRTRKFL